MKILSVIQIRAAEQDAVQNGIFSFKDLMFCAAQKSAEYLTENVITKEDKICVVCGKGNNGGDGLVTAHILKNSGYDVSVVFPLGVPTASPANEYAYFSAELNNETDIPENTTVLIDALFGIGLYKPLNETLNSLIDRMNGVNAKKIALDIPSGIYGDGKGGENAFYADITLTFIAPKPCFFVPPYNEHCGKLEVIDIGVPVKEYAYQTVEEPKKETRKINDNKGTFGTVLTATGSYGMCGAAILSSKAALVSGVGVVKSFVCDKNYSAFTASLPEVVTVPCETSSEGAMIVYRKQLFEGLSTANAMLVGCGIGRYAESLKLVKSVLEIADIPIVLDADGINCIAGDIELLRTAKASVIITPHPGEMARICNVSVREIQKNRPEFAKKIAVNYNVFVVLKGANTVIASPDGQVFFNTTGNAGMATAGSGDVLAGMIAAELSKGLSPLEAAKKGVWLHGLAGDRALTKYGMNGLVASDIIAELKLM